MQRESASDTKTLGFLYNVKVLFIPEIHWKELPNIYKSAFPRFTMTFQCRASVAYPRLYARAQMNGEVPYSMF